MSTPDQPGTELERTLRRAAAHLQRRGAEYLERPVAAPSSASARDRAGAWRLRAALGATVAAAAVGAAVLAIGPGGSAGRLEPQDSTGGIESSSPGDLTTVGDTFQAIGDDTRPDDSGSDSTAPDGTGVDGTGPDGTGPGDTRLEPPVITVLPPPTVTTPGEQTSPFISEVEVPAVVAAGTSFTVRWRAADPDTVASTGVTIGWASGIYTECGIGAPGRLERGTTLDGTWAFTCLMPAAAVSTEYSLKVSAQDALGNWTESGWFYFSVVGGSDDAVPPAYSGIRIVSGAQVGAVLTVTWTLADESGIDSAVMWIAGPSGGFTDPAGNRYALYDTMVITPVCSPAGDSCTYTQTVQLSPTAAAGSYSLWLSATDTLGNKVLESVLSFTVVA